MLDVRNAKGWRRIISIIWHQKKISKAMEKNNHWILIIQVSYLVSDEIIFLKCKKIIKNCWHEILDWNLVKV